MTQRRARAYTYKVTTPPAGLPVTLDIFKSHIKRPSGPSSEDDLLTLYLGSAVEYAEGFTRRDFIERTYQTFRDFFPRPEQNEGYYQNGIIPSFTSAGVFSGDSNVGFEIRKSPLRSVVDITYIDATGTTGVVVPSTVYYPTLEEDYSEVVANDGQDWPEDILVALQAIQINFTCGLAADSTEFMANHPKLTVAILDHATFLWANRGDCGSGCGDGSSSVPSSSRSAYLQCRIENL